MKYLQKSFTIPEDLWNAYQAYLDQHPEMNTSGWIQAKIRDLLTAEKQTKTKTYV